MYAAYMQGPCTKKTVDKPVYYELILTFRFNFFNSFHRFGCKQINH